MTASIMLAYSRVSCCKSAPLPSCLSFLKSKRIIKYNAQSDYDLLEIAHTLLVSASDPSILPLRYPPIII